MANTKSNEFTTIQISKKIKLELNGKKIIEREPYNDVIKRLIKKSEE